MKIFKYLLIFFVISTGSYAAKLDDYIKISQNGKVDVSGNSLNKTLSDITKSTQDEIIKKLDVEIQKLQDSINKNINNITTKFDTEIQKATDRINNNIIGKGEKLIDDATNQYNSLIATKDKIISTVENLMNNLPTYIFIAKLIVAIIILGIFLLVFFFWRSYSKMKALSAALLKTGNLDAIDNINKKLDKLDAKIDKLISSLK